MRILTCIACLLIALSALATAAQQGTQPYDAKVVAEETWVRAGGGDKFYATQRLTAGAIVRVLRHDPGGWYVIEPPDGSFSWIAERFVERLSDTEGQVREDHVIAFVGSELADESSVFQRRMKRGEKVAILGSKTLDTSSGPQAMLKIKPPARERRWIPGAAVVPVDPERRAQAETNPWEFPSNSNRPPSIPQPPEDHGNGVTTDIPKLDPSDQLQRLQLEKAQRQELAEIDQRFRDMVLRDISFWNLDAIEAEYRSLQSRMSNRQTAGAVDLRFPAIERYRQRLAQLRDVKQLQSQTEARDAELVARHNGSWLMMPSAVRSASPNADNILQPPDSGFENFLRQQNTEALASISAAQQSGTGNQLQNPAADSLFPPTNPDNTVRLAADTESTPAPATGSETVIKPGSPQNRFVGAGIVQHAPGQTNGWILMTPSGKVLADLKPAPNLPLDQYLGRQVGVQGSRWSQK
ncbi:MAG: hypothetical protein RL215_188, partial [Planctomycetota bacterium]